MEAKLKKHLQNCRLDHVAVAVEDLDKGQAIYQAIGLEFEKEREVVTSQAVETAFAAIDEHAKLELLCPIGEDGPIHQFLAKKGPGLHHLCFSVTDIEAKMEELKTAGFKFIYPEPTKGAGGCLVNFIHPKSSGGVLIEISEAPKTS